MSHTVLPTTTTTMIVIEEHPFQSRACHNLIKALDDEVERLYPDHADFPYEGVGNWLTQDTHLNPVPDDGDNNSEKNTDRNGDILSLTEQQETKEVAEDESELFFFVAFVAERSVGLPTSLDQNGNEDNGGGDGDTATAVGCVGLRHLPWFPSHRAPSHATVVGSLPDESSTNALPPTVELKRMYVLPSYRGHRYHRQGTSTVADLGQSVAGQLLVYAETFARDRLEAKRLVLETGARQTAAMKLYQKNGWVRRPEFGDYVGAGEEIGGLSRCFEKWL